jgi:hypothetical protein
MTPTTTECSAATYSFGQLDRRQVVANFSGGQLISDGGLILVAENDCNMPAKRFLQKIVFQVCVFSSLYLIP